MELVRHQDIVQPFMLHNSQMRGRMVRLDDSVNLIVSRHEYPDVVSAQLAELLMISAMLATNLPEEGMLTMQVKGDGAVSFMVCDVQQQGGIRAYANIVDAALLAALPADSTTIKDIMGEGYLAMTLTTPYGDPYQGIVPLDGASLTDAVQHYFTQSQQLDVVFHHHIGRRVQENGSHTWVAAGIMLERMPTIEASAQQIGDVDEAWAYNTLLISTATPQELTDVYLAPSAVLYRLFNEGGVWVYAPHTIMPVCRCSREKIESVLHTMPVGELQEMAEEGIISVVCQFCNQEEQFDVRALQE
jgi:molecular chaperone Hsp33